jgi:hypothetical protein
MENIQNIYQCEVIERGGDRNLIFKIHLISKIRYKNRIV